ncbi:DUF58 domain-containing protein [bacterium]|nr:DUF58 domain-containing protein [bacterium]
MQKYLDPSLLDRLQRLELKARLVVEGHLSGMHKSPYKGFSVEFAEHKSYFPGDDIRYIDWKLYAKTEKFFIKQFEEETNLKSYIVFDHSASMKFLSGTDTKFVYGKFLATALSYMMLVQRDSVGCVTFNDDIIDYIPPRNELIHLHNIVSVLGDIENDSKTGICHALKFLASKIKRRGLIILISDLIDNQQDVISHLKYLRKIKHEVIVIHLIHPYELDLPYHGTVRFKNMEQQEQLLAIPDRIRKDYKSRIKLFMDKYQQECWKEKIDYNRIFLNTPPEQSIIDLIARRKHN